MNAEYSIEIDVPTSMVRIRMVGFFTAPDIARFLAERRAVHKQLTCGPNQHLTLNDLRDMKIQSQDMVVAFAGMLSDPVFRSRKLAFVVGSTLARMQVIRAMGDRKTEVFPDIAAAEAWLLEPEQAAA